jgi:hypothetical protein
MCKMNYMDELWHQLNSKNETCNYPNTMATLTHVYELLN